MKKFMALFMATMMTVSLAACGGSSSESSSSAADAGSDEKVYEIKLHHDLLEETAQHQGLVEFKEMVEEQSEGRLSITIFANNTLGSDTEVAEYLQTGSVQAALIPTAKLSGFHAPLQVLDLPYIFPTREDCYEVLDNQEFKDMLFDPMTEIGFKGINFWESGFKQLTANKTITSPDDFIGMKFRTMESPLLIAQYEAMGASPVPIDFGETYNSLQQGVVDGQENPLVSIRNMKFYEVQTDLIISNHAYLAYAFLFSNSFWETLPEDLQTIILDAAEVAVQSERELTIESEDGYIAEMADYGINVSYLTEEQSAVFAEAMIPVHEQFTDVIGADLINKVYEITGTN